MMLDGDVSQARGSGRIDVTGELLHPSWKLSLC